MYCQLCIKLGGKGKDFEICPLMDIVKHAKIHQFHSSDGNTKKVTNVYLDWCFLTEPDVDKDENASEPLRVKNGRPTVGASKRKFKKSPRLYPGAAALKSLIRNEQIWCQICTKMIRALEIPKALAHAMVHAKEIPIYGCKKCKHSCSNYYIMCGHIRTIHKCCAMGNYIDRSEKFEKEINKAIENCYGKGTNASTKRSAAKDPDKEDCPSAKKQATCTDFENTSSDQATGQSEPKKSIHAKPKYHVK